tara:strand:+ start:1709 stop:2245 length:537 start_codon:yes stop_codon:yes gene_type:complete
MSSVINPDSGSLHILGTIDTISGISSKLNITNISNVNLATPTLGDAALNVTGGGYIGGHLYVDGSIVANGDIVTLGNTGSGVIIDVSPTVATTTINANSSVSYLNATTSLALALGNGTEGQIKVIAVTGTPTGTVVITPTTSLGYTSFNLTNIGESVTIVYTIAGWAVTSVNGAIITV